MSEPFKDTKVRVTGVPALRAGPTAPAQGSLLSVCLRLGSEGLSVWWPCSRDHWGCEAGEHPCGGGDAPGKGDMGAVPCRAVGAAGRAWDCWSPGEHARLGGEQSPKPSSVQTGSAAGLNTGQ